MFIAGKYNYSKHNNVDLKQTPLEFVPWTEIVK